MRTSNVYSQLESQIHGKGFEKKQFSKGSGMSNIENRTKESGWIVSWQQVQPSGTKVVIASDKEALG